MGIRLYHDDEVATNADDRADRHTREASSCGQATVDYDTTADLGRTLMMAANADGSAASLQRTE